MKLDTPLLAQDSSLLLRVELVGEVSEELLHVVHSRALRDVHQDRSFEEELAVLVQISSDDSSLDKVDNLGGEDFRDLAAFLPGDIND